MESNCELLMVNGEWLTVNGCVGFSSHLVTLSPLPPVTPSSGHPVILSKKEE